MKRDGDPWALVIALVHLFACSHEEAANVAGPGTCQDLETNIQWATPLLGVWELSFSDSGATEVESFRLETTLPPAPKPALSCPRFPDLYVWLEGEVGDTSNSGEIELADSLAFDLRLWLDDADTTHLDGQMMRLSEGVFRGTYRRKRRAPVREISVGDWTLIRQTTAGDSLVLSDQDADDSNSLLDRQAVDEPIPRLGVSTREEE